MIPDRPNGNLLDYRVTQLEKRHDELEKATSQIRDALVSIRNDVAMMRTAAERADSRRRHDGEFRWTKLQAWSAIAGVVIVLAFNFYFAARPH